MAQQPLQRAWIGVGANLGDPIRCVREALAALAHIEQSSLIGHSSLYRTAPVGEGCAGQPDYINAVAGLDTTLAAPALLQALFAIEQNFGRQRSVRNAARTLDLDLLLYGEASIALPDLQVPHPRMHERAFVLFPLAELAPDTLIPGHDTVRHLLARLDDQGIQRLAPQEGSVLR